jgi:Cd2+/Zn2+-exporting ATPase
MSQIASDHTHAHDHGHPDHHHDHKHDHASPVECCSHHELEIERYIILYLIGGMLAITSWIAGKAGVASPLVTIIPAVIGAIMLAIPLFWASIKEIKNGRISSSSLAALAILAGLAVGEYIVAAILAFFLLVADQVLRRTAFSAQRAIEDLVGLTPDIARIIEDGKEREAQAKDVSVGMTVRVRPGENLPVDGIVTSGITTINQASLTGEALPIEASEGTEVFAGTTNLTGVIDLKVTRTGGDTTIGKVTELIREAESSRSPRQLLIEQVSRFFVPVALSVAALVWFINRGEDDAAIMAITVLVVVCPSGLLLASPSAMVAAFAAAARLGIMIKQASYLEAAAGVDAVVLDKTGTITTGSFEVSRLAPAEGVEGADLLASAAHAEQSSNHPLASSIMRTAQAARISPAEVHHYEEIHGRGVKANTGTGEILAGRAAWIKENLPHAADQITHVEQRIEGMSGVHVARDGHYLGAVGLEDKVRAQSKPVIERLREMGARTIAIFTGDRLSVAKRVGQTVGADRLEAECLPEDKNEQIEALVNQGYKVMMVGDGINDGPALARADVGVAMGLRGSDIATNSAGVALMTDDLNRLPFLVELGRKTRAITGQNIAASILIALVGLTLAATGNLGENSAPSSSPSSSTSPATSSSSATPSASSASAKSSSPRSTWQRKPPRPASRPPAVKAAPASPPPRPDAQHRPTQTSQSQKSPSRKRGVFHALSVIHARCPISRNAQARYSRIHDRPAQHPRHRRQKHRHHPEHRPADRVPPIRRDKHRPDPRDHDHHPHDRRPLQRPIPRLRPIQHRVAPRTQPGRRTVQTPIAPRTHILNRQPRIMAHATSPHSSVPVSTTTATAK